MMAALAIGYLGLVPLWHELTSVRDVLFWLMLGGFIWVIGDLFQQYATKYVGISRGIPLSNTNQFWGLLWGIFVFGELHGSAGSTYVQVVGGSLLMMLGVGAIAFSSAAGKEQAQWQEAALRESRRYNLRKISSRLACRESRWPEKSGRHALCGIGFWWPSPPGPSCSLPRWRALASVFPLGAGTAVDHRDRDSASGVRRNTLADHSLQLNLS